MTPPADFLKRRGEGLFDFKFYLGINCGAWLWRAPDQGPLFVAYHLLARRKSPFPQGVSRFALDSGAYTQIAKHGRWLVTAPEYAARVCQMNAELGTMDWAAIQDWLCDPESLHSTGLTVVEHQRRTVSSWIALRKLAPQIPWLPVLQGWSLADFQRHVEMYGEAGTDLAALELVGVGSIARRQQDDEALDILEALAERGLRLHGFGVKISGLRRALPHLRSSDSMAWSWIGRVRGEDSSSRNSKAYAEKYRAEVLELVARAEERHTFVTQDGVLALFGG